MITCRFLCTFLLSLITLDLASGADADKGAPASENPWPKLLNLAGASEDSHLALWTVESPTQYSGHYVSQSVTDGWEDLFIVVKSVGSGAGGRWLADVYLRDDRDENHRDGILYRDRPVASGQHPSFRMKDGDAPLFFATRLVQGTKGPSAKPFLVSGGGAAYALDGIVPPAVMLEGRETPLKFEPWQTDDPVVYAGTYVSVSRTSASTREVEVTVHHEAKSLLPWRIDADNTVTGTDEKYPDYEYTNRPLWAGAWPHFNAHDTFILVMFTDPRSKQPKAEPALVTELGEVLVKRREMK